MILKAGSYDGDRAKYRPTLKVNEENPDFIDVRIPHHDDGRSYWIVIATKELADEDLEFRGIAWGGKIPSTIESFARLGESADLWAGEEKRKGYIDFTVHKKILTRCYVYHDYDFPLDDGGYYYTYKLPDLKVEQAGASDGEKP